MITGEKRVSQKNIFYQQVELQWQQNWKENQQVEQRRKETTQQGNIFSTGGKASRLIDSTASTDLLDQYFTVQQSQTNSNKYLLRQDKRKALNSPKRSHPSSRALPRLQRSARPLPLARLSPLPPHKKTLFAETPEKRGRRRSKNILSALKSSGGGGGKAPPPLSVEQMLYKIYFENLKYEEIKENLFFALQQVSQIDQFFNLIFVILKKYSQQIAVNLQKLIYYLFPDFHEIQNILVLDVNAQGGEGLDQVMAGMFQPDRFEQNSHKYLEVIDIFYKEFKQVQDCSVEITKIVNIYLYNFIEKNNKVNFNAQFYVKIFNFFVYNQTFINKYINSCLRFFNQNKHIQHKYQQAFATIQNIQQFLVISKAAKKRKKNKARPVSPLREAAEDKKKAKKKKRRPSARKLDDVSRLEELLNGVEMAPQRVRPNLPAEWASSLREKQRKLR